MQKLRSTRKNLIYLFILGWLLTLLCSLPVAANLNLTESVYQSAQQQYEYGYQLYEQERYIESLRALEIAKRLFASGSHPVEIAVISSAASLVQYQLGNLDAARKLIDNALAVGQLHQNPLAKAQVLDIKAKLLYAAKEPNMALQIWQEAQAIYSRQGDIVGQILNQINQTYARSSLGDQIAYSNTLSEINNERILALMQDIIAISDRNRKLVIQAVSGFLNFSKQYSQAIEFLKIAIENDPNDLENKFRLAELLSRKGDRENRNQNSHISSLYPLQCVASERFEIRAPAIPYYQDAIQYHKAILDANPPAALRIRTKVQLLELFQKTQQDVLAQQLLPISFSEISESRQLVKNKIELAQALNCISPQLVLPLLKQSEFYASRLSDLYAQAEANGNLGAYYENRDLELAREYTQKAIGIASEIYAPKLRYQWLWQAGRIASQNRQVKDALDYYASASEDLKRVRGNYTNLSQDIKFSFLQDVLPFYRQYLTLLTESVDSRSDLKAAEAVFIELQIAELEDFLRCQSSNLVPLTQISRPNSTIIYPILLGDRLELIAELPSNWVLKRFGKNEQCNLFEGATIHCSLSISRNSFTDELDKFKHWAKNGNSNPSVLQNLSQNIYQYLIEPLAAYLPPEGTLVFVVDGDFQGLPFAALYDGEQYLIEKYSLAASIGSQFNVSRAAGVSNANVILAGISDVSPYWKEELGKLSHVRTEIQGIGSLTAHNTLLNHNLTYENFLAALEYGNPEILHLATHGQFNTDPEKTELFLWDRSITINDFAKLLTVGAEQNPTPLQLLVLSACETATGDRRSTLGIAGTAVRANAQSTVASLWQVNDRSTAKLMEQFYHNLLRESTNKAEALRQAQLRLLYDRDRNLTPYHWAGFILVGDWS